MTDNGIKGRVHSFQSLGTVDGPGVRFVVFAQGCPLRCACCHNPDTWDMAGGKEYTPRQIVDRVLRYREYFGEEGGITVSGGEPLMQAEFVAEIFALCKAEGINTCLDTSGVRLDGQVRELLKLTDRVLLDVKYVSDEDYKAYVGCGIQPVLSFLEYLDKEGIPTTVRQVIIPSLNSSEDKVRELVSLLKPYSCIQKLELLPFRKICTVKYDSMGLSFPLADAPEPSQSTMTTLKRIAADEWGARGCEDAGDAITLF